MEVSHLYVHLGSDEGIREDMEASSSAMEEDAGGGPSHKPRTTAAPALPLPEDGKMEVLEVRPSSPDKEMVILLELSLCNV